MQSIKIDNKKLAENDQQFADALVEDCVTKERSRCNFNRREAEKTVYFAHVWGGGDRFGWGFLLDIVRFVEWK